MTPHLGASTEEAQENVGIEVAEAITDYLVERGRAQRGEPAEPGRADLRVVKPFLTLGEKLGRLVAQLAPKRNDRLVITYGGKASEVPSDPITRSVLKGFLELAGGKEVNQVNVRTLARRSAWRCRKSNPTKRRISMNGCTWRFSAATRKFRRAARFMARSRQPRIVRVNSQPVEIVPEGVLFLMNNKDRPGIVGYLGALMGSHNVNIANMSLSRDIAGGRALTVLSLDSVPPAAVLEEVRKDPDISDVRVVKL